MAIGWRNILLERTAAFRSFRVETSLKRRQRPNLIADPKGPETIAQSFNTSAFAVANTTFGTAGRGSSSARSPRLGYIAGHDFRWRRAPPCDSTHDSSTRSFTSTWQPQRSADYSAAGFQTILTLADHGRGTATANRVGSAQIQLLTVPCFQSAETRIVHKGRSEFFCNSNSATP